MRLAVEVLRQAAKRYQLSERQGCALLGRAYTGAYLGVASHLPAQSHRDALTWIANFVRSRGGVLITDEIYHGLTYGEPAHTACQKMYLSSTAFKILQHDGVAPRQARFAALLNRRA